MSANDTKTVLTRRGVIKGASVATGVAVVGGGALLYGSQPVAATHLSDWTADNTEIVQSDDGTVTAVNTAAGIELEWQNFADGADSADITITAHLRAADNDDIAEDKSDVIYDAAGITSSTTGDGVSGVTDDDAALDGTNTNGGVTISLDEIDMTNVFDADNSGETEDITEVDFEDDDSSTANKVTTVELQLQTIVNGAQSADPTADVSATFDVEVENLEEEQTTGGTSGTSAE